VTVPVNHDIVLLPDQNVIFSVSVL